MADSNRVNVGYIKEVTWGTTPAGALQLLPFTGESLAFNIANKTSDAIRSDRQTSNLIQTGADCGGGVRTELVYGAYDELILGVLGGSAWVTTTGDIMKAVQGTTRHSFTIERQHTDVAQFFQFRGMVVDKMTLNIAANAIATLGFEFKGKSATRTVVTAATVPTPVAASTKVPMNGVTNVGTILVNGAALTGTYIKEINLEIGNSLAGDDAIGVLGFADVSLNELDVKGSLKMKFADGTMYDRYLAGTEFALSFVTTDAAGNKYTWTMDACKVSGEKINAGGKNTRVLDEINFTAFMDSVTGNTIEILRDPMP